MLPLPVRFYSLRLTCVRIRRGIDALKSRSTSLLRSTWPAACLAWVLAAAQRMKLELLERGSRWLFGLARSLKVAMRDYHPLQQLSANFTCVRLLPNLPL